MAITSSDLAVDARRYREKREPFVLLNLLLLRQENGSTKLWGFIRPSQIKNIGGSINSSQRQVSFFRFSNPQSFAPPHDPASSNGRSILRLPSVSGNMRINTSGIPNHNRISRGPNLPTTRRLNSLGGHGPNSPTFFRRPRENSDAC
ncbi:17132_t:CDS:2, partial [Funneliformis caledonium]